MLKKAFVPALLSFMVPAGIFVPATAAAEVSSPAGAVASRTDGVTVLYYGTLHEAFEAAGGTPESPDEISLLADAVLDGPLTVADGAHIRLVAGGSDRAIRRGGGNIEFPVIWVKGDGASLTLGKPDMEYELVVDGGYVSAEADRNDPPLIAHAPLAAVSGPGSKLVMYDGLTLQNNYNFGKVLTTSHYQNGAGVFIRTEGDIDGRQAEFIMKGGVIRGNVNNLRNVVASGGGVFIAGFGVFTMEGGVIMDNTARQNGGGFHTGSRGSFYKTGGVIYGSNAPAGLRNIVVEGTGTPLAYGHSVCVGVINPVVYYRDDTVKENDNLSYTGAVSGNGIFGKGEKWDNPDKDFKRTVFVIILGGLAFGVLVFLLVMKAVLKKRLAKITLAADGAPEVDFSGLNLTDREKEICTLLLTELTFKEIASVLKLSGSGVSFHAQKLYRKLGIQSRTELFVKLKSG